MGSVLDKLQNAQGKVLWLLRTCDKFKRGSVWLISTFVVELEKKLPDEECHKDDFFL
jgi:hypothetical protein